MWQWLSDGTDGMLCNLLPSQQFWDIPVSFFEAMTRSSVTKYTDPFLSRSLKQCMEGPFALMHQFKSALTGQLYELHM